MNHNTNMSRIRISIGLLAAVLCSAAAHAGGVDPFGTDNTLRRDTKGLTDPLGHDCAVPGGALSFPSAVNLALCRNPQTRQAWALAHQQAAALGAAESAWLPTIAATGDRNRDYGKHADINGNIVDTPQNSTDAAVNLTWTLYDFGGRTGRIESAHRLLDAAAATASSVVQQTVRSVVQDYYGVVAGDASLVAAKSTEGIAAHSLEILQGKFSRKVFQFR